ncbi:MAG TPA: DNRLRE domain-containing protein, partial [Humisphaera sp.]
ATAANTGGAAFRTGEGVDLKVVSGTNYAIASATAGEWAEYTVDVAAAGTYKLEVRAAAAAAGGKVHAELRDPATDAVAAALGGSIAVPNTGSTSTFATVSKTAALPAGRYVLRLAIDANATNGVAGVFDWLKLSAVPVTVKSTAAAYVRGGTSAGANFGAATDLSVRKAATAADTRETYIKFDLAAAGVAALTSAKLRLYGRLSDTSVGSLATTVYSAADTAWGESTITWNNKPAAGTTSRGTVTVGGTAAKWYELDLTAFLKAELAAGRGVVTLVLRNGATSTAQSLFAGDEQANGPQLVVVR